MALPKLSTPGATAEDITENREKLQKSMREGQNRITVSIREQRDVLNNIFSGINSVYESMMQQSQESISALSTQPEELSLNADGLKIALSSEEVLKNIHATMEKMHDGQEAAADEARARAGFDLEQSRENDRPDADPNPEKDPKPKGGMFGGLGKIFSKYATLIKLAVAGIFIALLAFFQSDTWKSMRKVIVDDIIPALESLYYDYIKPIALFFWDSIIKQWENIKSLFSGLKESFALFGEGKWWEGIKTFFSTIGTYMSDTIDNLLTLVWNVIATTFGLGETDSVFGSIKKFFVDMYNDVVFWITSTWENITTTISDTFTNVKNSVMGLFTGLWDSVTSVLGEFSLFKFFEDTFGDIFTTIKAIFGGDFSLENLLKGGLALLDLVLDPINLAINTIKDIFKWGDPEKPFRFSDFLFGPEGVVTKVVNFFKNMFGAGEEGKGLDLGGMFSSMIPDFELPSWDTIKSKIGEVLNNMIQGLAKFLEAGGLPDSAAGGISDLGVAIATKMGAKTITKFNPKSDKIEEGTITADGFRVSTQKELDAKTKAAADAKETSQNNTIITKGGDSIVNAPTNNNGGTAILGSTVGARRAMPGASSRPGSASWRGEGV